MKKRKFLVAKRTTKDIKIDVGRGHRKFWRENGGKSDIMFVSDPSEAADIDAVYGKKGSRDVFVKEYDKLASFDRDEKGQHRYFFGSNRAFRDGWEEIFEGGRNGRKKIQGKKSKARRRWEVCEDGGLFEEEGEVRQVR